MSRLMMGILMFLSSAMLLASGGARAATMACQDGGSGYCSLGSTGNYGSVTVTGLGTSTVDIFYTLSVGTIADPADASVVFDIIGATGATVLDNTNTSDYNGWLTFNFQTFSFQQDAYIGSQGIDADEGPPAFGTFTGGASCQDSNGCGTKVEIQVTGTDLQLGNTGGYFAAIDTQTTGQQCYGEGRDQKCYPVTENGAVAEALSTTPLPAALPLFATVIGAGFLGFRRRGQALAVTA
jgi:hypothetical protein